jgi:hypothetical protein
LFALSLIRYTGREFHPVPTSGKLSMSELNERRWAVLSERGCEDAGLSYGEAAAMVARLRGERISGLCVVTDTAAAHLPHPKKPASKSAPGGNSGPRRSRKKSVT